MARPLLAFLGATGQRSRSPARIPRRLRLNSPAPPAARAPRGIQRGLSRSIPRYTCSGRAGHTGCVHRQRGPLERRRKNLAAQGPDAICRSDLWPELREGAVPDSGGHWTARRSVDPRRGRDLVPIGGAGEFLGDCLREPQRGLAGGYGGQNRESHILVSKADDKLNCSWAN
jgi:hypothetical protein